MSELSLPRISFYICLFDHFTTSTVWRNSAKNIKGKSRFLIKRPISCTPLKFRKNKDKTDAILKPSKKYHQRNQISAKRCETFEK